MKRFTSFALPFVFLCAAGLGVLCSAGVGAAAEESTVPAEVQAGRKVALQVCASCHTVSAGPQRKPYLKSPATNFSVIANKPDTTAASLLRFLSTRHQSITNWREMPGVKTTDAQDRAVADYIMSLRKPARTRR
ncbi:c-type cytochrome [Caulobacter sp. KR2-114]|uniref:c-type cytochrome n=1 Tax=Caulobacter sp. KR2-114 TaxID=3400912 RepID=UPI003C052B9B